MSARRFVVCAAAASLVALTGSAPVTAAPARGSVQIIQAVPKASVTVIIDGRRVESGVGLGTVLGPYDTAPGKHSVRFVDAAGEVSMAASVTVKAGASTDVVLHRPASATGEPVVNVYSTPRKPIGPGKARVMLAHTATVAPADVRVDGKVVFTNIANGEFAEAEVPAGKHKVELLPTGETRDPILGPIEVDLAPRTVTMVYAVGTPSNGSMDVIAHTSVIASDGTVVPDTIKTGSAGLAAGERVSAFSTPGRTPAAGAGPLGWLWVPVGAALLLVGTGLRLRRASGRVRASSACDD
jgi:hypothetical protein